MYVSRVIRSGRRKYDVEAVIAAGASEDRSRAVTVKCVRARIGASHLRVQDPYPVHTHTTYTRDEYNILCRPSTDTTRSASGQKTVTEGCRRGENSIQARFPCVTVTQENNIVSCSRFISLSLSRSFSLPFSLSLLRTLNIARVVLLVYSLIYAARSVAPLPVLCTTRSSRSLQRVSHRSLAVPLTRRFCIVLSLSSASHTAPCADPTRETDTRCFACVWHSECVSLSLSSSVLLPLLRFLCYLPHLPLLPTYRCLSFVPGQCSVSCGTYSEAPSHSHLQQRLLVVYLFSRRLGRVGEEWRR